MPPLDSWQVEAFAAGGGDEKKLSVLSLFSFGITHSITTHFYWTKYRLSLYFIEISRDDRASTHSNEAAEASGRGSEWEQNPSGCASTLTLREAEAAVELLELLVGLLPGFELILPSFAELRSDSVELLDLLRGLGPPKLLAMLSSAS